MPVYSLAALITIPLAIKAIRGSFGSPDLGIILPAMGKNVIVVLATQALIGIGYVLAAVI
jgi:hypothetical protein